MSNLEPGTQRDILPQPTKAYKANPKSIKQRPTKKVQLIQMLSRKSGADATIISKKLGWLPHTTRAALSGLRKAGYKITIKKMPSGKPSIYRVTGTPEDNGVR